MKNLTLLSKLEFGVFGTEKDKDANVVFDGTRGRIMEVKLRNGAVLSKHKAVEPITVFCLAGSGTFYAGADLEESQELTPGVLIALESGVFHEVAAEPELHVLVTKFKGE